MAQAAAGGGGGARAGDLYSVLGLSNDCSDAELRNAYKRLALRWHPDRWSASGNSMAMNEAKEKFQEIHHAYSVLSDSNKRFLYDVGVYDASDDDDNNGMADFLGEMVQMMNQTKPNNNDDKGHETLEDLQQLFVDMFQPDLDAGFGAPQPKTNRQDRSGSGGNHKRGSSAMAGKAKLDELDTGTAPAFCFGLNNQGDSSRGRGGSSSSSRRRNGRKQKVSSRHDVSSCDAGIST